MNLRWDLLSFLLSALFLGIGIGTFISFTRTNHASATRRKAEAEAAAQRPVVPALPAASPGEDRFAALSSLALKENSEAFLRQSRENLAASETLRGAPLTGRSDGAAEALEALVSPIRDALDKTGQQLRTLERENTEAYGALAQQIKSVAESQNLLRLETRSLMKVLRRPETRRHWGGLTLKRLADMAGVLRHCEFPPQTDAEPARPEMMLRLPNRREIAADASMSLDAYFASLDEPDTAKRERLLKEHTHLLRRRVGELSAKSYWAQFKEPPDFVVLFLPGDQFLLSALEQDPKLQEDALHNRVILATPTSMVALLRAVSFSWRQLATAQDAQHIRELGVEMYNRVAAFTEHLSRLGQNLNMSVEQFNRAVGSLEDQLLPGARRFVELGVQPFKEPAEVAPVATLAQGPGERH